MDAIYDRIHNLRGLLFKDAMKLLTDENEIKFYQKAEVDYYLPIFG